MPYFSYIILSIRYPIRHIGIHVPKNMFGTYTPIYDAHTWRIPLRVCFNNRLYYQYTNNGRHSST